MRADVGREVPGWAAEPRGSARVLGAPVAGGGDGVARRATAAGRVDAELKRTTTEGKEAMDRAPWEARRGAERGRVRGCEGEGEIERREIEREMRGNDLLAAGYGRGEEMGIGQG